MKIANMFTQRELEMLEFLTRSASNHYEGDCYGILKLEAVTSIRSKLGFEALVQALEPKGDELFKTMDIMLYPTKTTTSDALFSFGISMSENDLETAMNRTSVLQEHGYSSYKEWRDYQKQHEYVFAELMVAVNGDISLSVRLGEQGKKYPVPLEEKEIDFLKQAVTEKHSEIVQEIGERYGLRPRKNRKSER